jgi:ubiquinone/menaquinone biosynthesis C-methylase UbiE
VSVGFPGSAAGAGFDAWARSYEHSILQPRLYDPAQHAALELARRLAPRPRCILDVGCGTGRLLRHARGHYPSATLVGVDVSATMLVVAASTAQRATIHPIHPIHHVRATAERLPFSTARFDLVLATMALRHWSDLEAGVGEIHRVLTGGGVLVVADVFPTGGRRGRLRCWTRDPAGPAGPAAWLAAILTLHGLTVVARDRVPWPLLPDIQVIAARATKTRAATTRALELGHGHGGFRRGPSRPGRGES